MFRFGNLLNADENTPFLCHIHLGHIIAPKRNLF